MIAPSGLSPLQRLRQLWLAPDLALVGQRRERRMSLLACAVILVMGCGWGIFFVLQARWGIALMDLGLIACAIGVFVLTLRGQVRSANLLLFGAIIAIVGGMALVLDAPTTAAPRSVHLYLLPLAIAAFMAFRQEPTWLRYGMAALCLVLFVGLAATTWAPFGDHNLPDELRRVGSWIQSATAMSIFLMLLHILQTDAVHRTQLDRELRTALHEGQFVLHYQPQLDQHQRVIGAEALIRWQHPRRGLLAPGEFIAHAEQSGLIVPIGAWVLEQACVQLQTWHGDPACRALSLAINISQTQVRQPAFAADMSAVIRRYGIDAQRLELELTETLLVQDLEDLTRKMHLLVAQGVRFSLDDFGTGFSSLSHLKRLPLSKLKIDRSFVCDLPGDASSETIVRTVLRLGQRMALTVVAEGVETDAQHRCLAGLGCTQFQGYLFSKPLPVIEFMEFVHKRNTVAAA